MAWIWLAALMALGACSRSSREQSMPAIKLPTLAGGSAQSLKSCPTAKCLTVVVAPWCPYCRAATAKITELRNFLKKRNIVSKVVVGTDKPQAVLDYAREFGADTLLDFEGSFAVQGVPHFIVTDSAGSVIKDVPGMPQIDDVKELASYFGLMP